MTIEQLREARERRPFRPFEIRMSGGESYTIGHPDNIAWNAEMRVASLIGPERSFVLVDVDQITSIVTPERARGGKESGR